MFYMLYIDGYAAWSAATFTGAKELARGYINGSRPLKIVGYEAARQRTWIYDYDRSAWLEHGSSDAAGAGS